MHPVLLILTIPVGYTIGFVLGKKSYRRVVPIALLTLGVVLFVVAGVVASSDPGLRDCMIDLARGSLQGSSLLVVTSGASAGWAFTQRPLIALAIGAPLAVIVGLVWGIILLTYACWWFGDCMIWP